MTELLIVGGLALVAALVVAWKKGLFHAKPPKGLHLGPFVRGKRMTVGTELEGQSFAFPHPNREAGHVHALVQFGPVRASKRITVDFVIEAEPGVTFHPQEHPGNRGEISLMIERKGNTYSGSAEQRFHRLYAPNPQFIEIGPGRLVADLTDPAGWIGVHGEQPSAAQFAEVLANAISIQICFGGGASRAHGVFASGPARFTLVALRTV